MRALTEELSASSFKEKLKCSKNESQLLKALKALDEKERSAIYLRFWVPCSIEEVAKQMHISWPQADALIERALQKLRNHFRKAGLLS